jgi:hypothetical protein
MIFRPGGTKTLSDAADSARSDIHEATERVGEAADAAAVLMTVLAGAVVFALALSAAAYVKASSR